MKTFLNIHQVAQKCATHHRAVSRLVDRGRLMPDALDGKGAPLFDLEKLPAIREVVCATIRTEWVDGMCFSREQLAARSKEFLDS